MIWDEQFICAALDVPVEESIPSSTPSTAVKYSKDLPSQLWIKTVDLELCDRSSLASLLAYVNFLRKLSSVNRRPLTDENNERTQTDLYLSLPSKVHLENSRLIIAYPLCTLGSTLDVLCHSKNGLPERIVAAIISRAVLCLEQLHVHGILHRAICSQHLLLSTDKDDNIRVLLCGLGSVAQFPPAVAFQMGRNDLPPVNFSWRGWRRWSHLPENFRTHPMAWNAPEVIAQDFTGYSWPADIYSIGLCMAELFNGEAPHVGADPSVITLSKLCDTEMPLLGNERNDNPSADMLQVYHACLERNPRRRPSARKLLQMRWIEQALNEPFTRADLEFLNIP